MNDSFIAENAGLIAEALRSQAKRESGKGGQAGYRYSAYGRGMKGDMRAMHLDKAKTLRELAKAFEEIALDEAWKAQLSFVNDYPADLDEEKEMRL